MAKTTFEDIEDLRFTKEMFNYKTEDDFKSMVDGVIEEQEGLLKGRLGQFYDSDVSPVKEYVRRAAKCLVCAEVIQRRINIILGNAVGAGRDIDISHEAAQKRVYLIEAQGDDGDGGLIAKILGSMDFAFGTSDSSHLEEAPDA
jgi:hypothetical protein